MAPTPTEPTTKRNEEAIINRALEALDMRDDLNARSSNTNNHSHTNNLSRGGGRDGLFASPNANGGERNKMRVEKQRRSFLSRIAAKKKGANTEARGVIKEEKAKQSKEVERDIGVLRTSLHNSCPAALTVMHMHGNKLPCTIFKQTNFAMVIRMLFV